MSQLRDEPTGRREPVTLHEVRLQRAEPGIAVRERGVRFAQLGEAGRERATHGVEGRGDLVDLADARRRHRCVEVAAGECLGRAGQLVYRSRNPRGQHRA